MFASGWQLSGIFRYSSGNFATVTTGIDNALLGLSGAAQRPDQILGNPYVLPRPGSQTFSIQYLNRDAFTTARLGPGILGTLAPLNIQNPGVIQTDMGLSRTFAIREGKTVQFRWEVFNVPNRLNAGAPSTNYSQGTFGQITSAGDPRIMQLALKFGF